jgi:hypothetical protein
VRGLEGWLATRPPAPGGRGQGGGRLPRSGHTDTEDRGTGVNAGTHNGPGSSLLTLTPLSTALNDSVPSRLSASAAAARCPYTRDKAARSCYAPFRPPHLHHNPDPDDGLSAPPLLPFAFAQDGLWCHASQPSLALACIIRVQTSDQSVSQHLEILELVDSDA